MMIHFRRTLLAFHTHVNTQQDLKMEPCCDLKTTQEHNRNLYLEVGTCNQ